MMAEGILAVGVMTTIIGLGVVFIVLIVLMFCIKAMRAIIEGTSRKKTVAVQAPAPEAALRAAAPAPAVEAGITPEVIAAIAAAISAVTGTAVSGLRFTSIRRMEVGMPTWAASGANEIMSSRQSYSEGGRK